MDWTPQQVFDHFPEPVVLLEGGAVRYFNPACARLIPAMEVGGGIPKELSALMGSEAVPRAGVGAIGGMEFRVSVQEAGPGTLVMLRAETAPPAGPGLERLTLRLRQETAGLAATLQRLDPGEEEPDREKWSRYLAHANRGIYRLARMAGQLEFADAKDGMLYRPAVLDLAGFCLNLCREVESALSLAGYRFTYESERSSLITAGDERLLRQMILALISNGAKAAGQGGALGLRLSTTGGRAVLTVWDEGPGPGEGGLARFFGAADTRPSTDPAEGLGLGLGLEAVRRIVRLHGGTVMVEGQPGEGLRVVVSLPVSPGEGRLPLRTPTEDYSGGFSPVMVELSDVLPAKLYAHEDLM